MRGNDVLFTITGQIAGGNKSWIVPDCAAKWARGIVCSIDGRDEGAVAIAE
jgi:hypothetical protein